MKKDFDDSVNERLLRMDIAKMTDKEFKTFEEEYKKKMHLG